MLSRTQTEVLVLGKLSRRPGKIEIGFTEEEITPNAGGVFLAGMARRVGLEKLLKRALRLKRRRRGASDAEMVLSLVYSLASGDGALRDLDRLGSDQARLEVLGLEQSPASRRLGEYLGRFDEAAVGELGGVVHEVARQLCPEVVRHEIETRGYVPVFLDGSAIEVDGQYIEGAKVGYDDQMQLWLHSGFIGSLWASHRLWPGGVDVARGWQDQLDKEIAPLIPAGTPVWARMDNAYYRRDVVEACRRRGWDYSISVTNETYKRPLRDKLYGVRPQDWQWITDDHTEAATIIRHRPDGWKQEQTYVAVRSYFDGPQRRLEPRHIFILVSRVDLPLKELVRRHRGKQGQENAQKGPLIDLDLHHPPCEKLNANRAFYLCGQLAQLLLIGTQYELLPKSARRHGLRTLIRDLMRTAGRLVRRGRRRILRFAMSALRLDWIAHAAERLQAFHPAL